MHPFWQILHDILTAFNGKSVRSVRLVDWSAGLSGR
jgi:hypothetical protein